MSKIKIQAGTASLDWRVRNWPRKDQYGRKMGLAYLPFPPNGLINTKSKHQDCYSGAVDLMLIECFYQSLKA